MRKTILILLLIFVSYVAVNAQRERILFNFDWLFSRDKVEWESVDLPHDYQIDQPWIEPSPDEKGDSQNEAANIKSLLSARAFKALGKGYYKKTFMPDEAWRGCRVLIDFEGMMLVGDAWLNGEYIGKTDYGYLGFESDITSKLKWGQENIIEVVCDTQNPKSSRWYTGGGLYRDVHIILTDREFYFTRHPLKIETRPLSPASVAGSPSPRNGRGCESPSDEPFWLFVQAELSNQSRQKIDSLTFVVKVKDANGATVAEKTVRKKYYGRQRTNEYKLDSLIIDNPTLWDIDNPYLYTAEVSVVKENGETLDKVSDTFGFRTIEYGADFGFKLNGRKVLLKGIANHHTLGALGAAAHERAMEKRIQMLKEFGVNHIRTSHNPYSESFLRLCDKYGILVVDELYDKWLKQFCGDRVSWNDQWQHDLPEWIKRDRNHPSVVMWSLGNELQQEWGMSFADWGVTNYRLMKTLLHRYDTSRPITVAMHPRFRDVDTDSLPAPLVHETDIAAYNYRYMYFPGDGKRFPWMKFYQSEANTQNIGRNFFEMDLDKVVGLAYWGAIDYLGESMGWPRKGWDLGEWDISLLPKPLAYFLKSFFKEDEPMVHLSVYRGSEGTEWNGVSLGTLRLTEDWSSTQSKLSNLSNPSKDSNPSKLSNPSKTSTPELKTLHAFSNADEVQLLINGKPFARLKNNRQDPGARNKFIFKDVPYAPGKAEAVAYNNGKEVARHAIETAGEVKSLKLEADNANWQRNGMDLQHVRIFAVDSKGCRVYGERGIASISLEGDATIVALSNGDITCAAINTPQSADKKTAEYPLYEGAAMVILRSKRVSDPTAKPQPVKLTVTLSSGKTFTKAIKL